MYVRPAVMLLMKGWWTDEVSARGSAACSLNILAFLVTYGETPCWPFAVRACVAGPSGLHKCSPKLKRIMK
jgi:hypothetical protein